MSESTLRTVYRCWSAGLTWSHHQPGTCIVHLLQWGDSWSWQTAPDGVAVVKTTQDERRHELLNHTAVDVVFQLSQPAKKQVLTSLLTCGFIVSSLSSSTLTSRTTSAGDTTTDPTMRDQSTDGLRTAAREPHQNCRTRTQVASSCKPMLHCLLGARSSLVINLVEVHWCSIWETCPHATESMSTLLSVFHLND